MTLNSPSGDQPHFIAPISKEIWHRKYQFKNQDGVIHDKTVEDTWRRIAKTLASCEPDSQTFEKMFYSVLENFHFIPAGRIIAGAGTGRNVTLSNCFTMGKIPDSMEGIFQSLKEAALTMQQGGGIGYDFSTIRPKGSIVKGVDSDASGPTSFMDCWDSMCRTIMSAGGRRGAMMATMRCDHPDIIDFITAKQDPNRLRMFNVSVLVTDDFMKAVENDDDWPLVHEAQPVHPKVFEGSSLHGETGSTKGKYVFDVIKARELWDTIMKSTYAYAEPGVIFIDRINNDHNLRYIETIATTNPCGEKPMGEYASCLLGSMNIPMFVRNAFTEEAYIDYNRLAASVHLAIPMMDNVIEVGGFPLSEQLEKAKEDRQLGLGITGLADALIMLRVKYGTPEAAQIASKIMETIDHAAYRASIEISKMKAPFMNFDEEKFLEEGTHASRLPEDLKNMIRTFGIRNGLLTSIAPTGTISMYANNVSSGIEPVFAPSYKRRVLNDDGTEYWDTVEQFSMIKYREFFESTNDEPFDPKKHLPDYFVTAQTLDPEAHIMMQAAVQKHVDSSISKTVNLPADISFEDFKDVYLNAYQSGCKGCTTHRPNDVTGSVLIAEDQPQQSVETASQASQAETTMGMVSHSHDILKRPEMLTGSTYKLNWPENAHALYITISDIFHDGKTRPFEIFINSKNMEHYAWTVALTRMISAVFRRGGDVEFVVEELKAVFDPRGGAFMKGGYVPSILAAIGGVIEQHMKDIGYVDSDEEVMPTEPDPGFKTQRLLNVPDLCPKCASSNFVSEGGCQTCKACGHSKCS